MKDTRDSSNLLSFSHSDSARLRVRVRKGNIRRHSSTGSCYHYFYIDTLYQTISYKQTPSIHATYLHSLLQQNVFNCQLSWLTACNSNSSISVASEASKFSAQVSSLPPLSLPLSSFSCSSISHCISLRRSSFLSAPNFSRTLATSSFRCFSAIDQGSVGTHYLSA